MWQASRPWLCSVAIALALASAAASATGRYDRAELAQLPPYCADSELSRDYVRQSPRWLYWTSRMGSNFNRIHHYCQGLLHAQAARRLLPRSHEQTIVLKLAVMEYNFILERSADQLLDFPLWPEVLIRRGEAAADLENWPLALASFEQARHLKPDYWPAYHGWAELLLRINMKAEAKDILLQGLRRTPQVEQMRQLYVKLGGKLTDFPSQPAVPAESADAAESAASAASAPASTASAPAP